MTQTDQQRTSGFNPNDHLMKIGYKEKAKDYLEVKWRLVWFREQCPQGTIDTEEMQVDLDRDVQDEVSVWNNEKRKMETVIKTGKGYARYRAIVTDGKGGRATATKSENAASFPDFIEKAETGAVGRALAMLGFGTQFTGNELAEHHRIVDSPVERQEGQQPRQAPSLTKEQASAPTVSNLRKDALELYPNRAFEDIYKFVIKREYTSDDAISPDEAIAIKKYLDNIRANRAKQASQPAIALVK